VCIFFDHFKCIFLLLPLLVQMFLSVFDRKSRGWLSEKRENFDVWRNFCIPLK
jgi:hypothetical protein